MSILQAPHPLLRMRCDEVVDFGEVRDIVAELIRAVNQLHQAKCVGLSAPQVGILRRVIIVEQGGQWITMVNPVIVAREGEQVVREGCMSIDHGRTFQRRTRAAFIRVEYADAQGNQLRRKAKAFNAAVIQHECDHLDGKLFTDEAAAA